jgi:hypothetical protein
MRHFRGKIANNCACGRRGAIPGSGIICREIPECYLQHRFSLITYFFKRKVISQTPAGLLVGRFYTVKLMPLAILETHLKLGI